MRVAFMGTPDFAVPPLRACLKRHEVVAVYTQPDRPKGRGRQLAPSPVKLLALEHGIPVEQPVTLRDPAVVERLRAYRPDVIVVAAYGLLLPQDVLSVPGHGCMNVHASLLPRWRGAAPIQRAILAGDDETGVCVMRMEAGLDTGPTCACATTSVDEKNAGALGAELARMGAETLVRSLTSVAEGTVVWTEQPAQGVTYAAKLSSADVALAPSLSVSDSLRRVRASGSTSPCRIRIGGRLLVVRDASRADARLAPGEVVTDGSLVIGVSDGAVRLDLVVPEGRAEMPGSAFVRGARFTAPVTWSGA